MSRQIRIRILKSLSLAIAYADPNLTEIAGSSYKLNSILGWNRMCSTVKSTNGGSRRPAISWTPGEPIGKITPRCICRIM